MTVYAFDDERTTNAQLVRDCAELGYLKDTDLILDPTYGRGRFWRLWRPTVLHASDIEMDRVGVGIDLDGSNRLTDFSRADFTNLPAEDGVYDAVTFDPPYKLNGTGGSHPSDEGYGVADKVTWQDRQDLIERGQKECARVLKPGGILLVKCQDQVSSGKVRWQTHWLSEFGEFECGLELIDILFVVGGIPQPSGRRQVHARRNYSTALIFQKAKR